jgi:hypothetical protein
MHEININNCSFSILKNEIRTSDMGGSVKELTTLTLNGKIYNNLIEYTRESDSLEENNCAYILYSKLCVMLKTTYITNLTS